MQQKNFYTFAHVRSERRRETHTKKYCACNIQKKPNKHDCSEERKRWDVIVFCVGKVNDRHHLDWHTIVEWAQTTRILLVGD